MLFFLDGQKGEGTRGSDMHVIPSHAFLALTVSASLFWPFVTRKFLWLHSRMSIFGQGGMERFSKKKASRMSKLDSRNRGLKFLESNFLVQTKLFLNFRQ